MKKEPTEKQKQQILIIDQLTRIIKIPLAGNERMYFQFTGQLLKTYDVDFILETFASMGEHELTEREMWCFFMGVLRNEYMKTHEPCRGGLDAIGR
ncbi:MAG: hypothetical protein KKF27_21425 [Gammaproteobacteria bacterium]|uniref:Uncharacterized protein n=1 Tax=viral metagenome TaxID=1070528 RepID=A0A6M3LR33_9ZZZZ|nr:hypothetical protein [Gammaproteobacteria bacterium]